MRGSVELPYQHVDGPTCSIRGDPHVVGFPHENGLPTVVGSLPFPCLYMAAAMTFYVHGQSGTNTNVSVSVMAASEMETRKGQFFIGSARVELMYPNIGVDPGSPIEVHEVTTAKVADAIDSGAPKAWTDTDLNFAHDVTVGNFLDVDNQAAYLVIGSTDYADFHIEIKFFPRLRLTRDRGIQVIVVQERSAHLIFAEYPDAMCSSLKGNNGNMQTHHGFTKDMMLLKAALDQGHYQKEPVCEDIFATYKSCGSLQETAVKNCYKYLNARKRQHGKAKCLEEKSSDKHVVIKTFAECMEYECNGQSGDSSFKDLCK